MNRPQATRNQTLVAHAIASPFPTASPVAVKPGQPARATAQRDGLSLNVELPKVPM